MGQRDKRRMATVAMMVINDVEMYNSGYKCMGRRGKGVGEKSASDDKRPYTHAQSQTPVQ